MINKINLREVEQLFIETIQEIQFKYGYATIEQIREKLFYLSTEKRYFTIILSKLLKKEKIKNDSVKKRGTYKIVDCSTDGEDLSRELRRLRIKMKNSPNCFVELPSTKQKAYEFYLDEIGKLIDKVEEFDKENKLEDAERIKLELAAKKIIGLNSDS